MVQTNKFIVEEVSNFVFDLFNKKLPANYVYHSLKHTEEVADNVRKIAGKMELNTEDTEILTLAAWFHDTGFIERTNNHEDISIEIAKKYLESIDYDPENLGKVIGCINATRYPQLPHNLLEEIIADADLYHLGTKEYSNKTELLRMEWERSQNKKFSDLEWLKINIDFLTSHKYFTRFAKKNLEEYKTVRLLKLQKQYKAELKKEESLQRREKKTEFKEEELSIKKETLKNIEGNIDIEIRNLIQNSVRSQLHISGMADRKANMMILVNTLVSIGLIATVVIIPVSNLLMLAPFSLILITNIFCITYSVQVLFPIKISEFFKNALSQRKFENSLFYEDSGNLKLEEFQLYVKENIKSRDQLSKFLLKELFLLKISAERKNDYLRKCYKIFVYGIIISIIATAILYITFSLKMLN